MYQELSGSDSIRNGNIITSVTENGFVELDTIAGDP